LLLTECAVVAILLAAPPTAPPPSTDLRAIADEAVRLYERGSYAEARASLESLDHAGLLDGPLLYRLYFCQLAAGRDDEAAGTLERARLALESELASAGTLDVPFYLANAYANLGRAEDARSVAKGATAKIESGASTTPETGIGLFQVGKLYQDQGREAEAIAYYNRAVAALDLKDGRYVGNARWALRYVGNAAVARDDYAASEAAFEKLAAIGEAKAADWTTLGIARARGGKFLPAAEAWKAAVKLDPANADDARYAARLAETAAILAPLPATAPSGAAFRALGQADLEAVLKERGEVVRTVQARAAEEMKPGFEGGPPRALPPDLRRSLEQELRTARGQFVAAGLEYAMRRLPIRETAFHEGYAVRIFQDSEWQLPPDP